MKVKSMNRVKLYLMSMIGALIGTLGVGILIASGAAIDTVMPVLLFTAGCLFMAWSSVRRR